MHLEDKYTLAVLDNALSAGVYRLAETQVTHLAECPNYWISREQLVEKQLRGVGEIVSFDLWDRVVGNILRCSGNEAWNATWQGCEYWSQVYHGGRGLEFHFDKDESRVKTKGEFHFPILSCVIYLTDDTEEEVQGDGGGGGDGGKETQGGGNRGKAIPKQSPTIVVDQTYRGSEGEEADAPHKTVLSYPKKNRVLVFDGRLAHGVLDSMNKTTRKTLLVNFWRAKPESLSVISEDDISRFNLLAHEQACASPGDEEEKGNDGSDDEPVKRELLEYKFKAIGEEEDDVVLLDDVSRSFSQKEFRDSFCVSIDHPSHVLYPIEASEGMEPCTLGAFCRED